MKNRIENKIDKIKTSLEFMKLNYEDKSKLVKTLDDLIIETKPSFEYKGIAREYIIPNVSEPTIAVDTDGLTLSNDNLPHKAYTLENGYEYNILIYKNPHKAIKIH